jgi:hypothetical protein
MLDSNNKGVSFIRALLGMDGSWVEPTNVEEGYICSSEREVEDKGGRGKGIG